MHERFKRLAEACGGDITQFDQGNHASESEELWRILEDSEDRVFWRPISDAKRFGYGCLSPIVLMCLLSIYWFNKTELLGLRLLSGKDAWAFNSFFIGAALFSIPASAFLFFHFHEGLNPFFTHDDRSRVRASGLGRLFKVLLLTCLLFCANIVYFRTVGLGFLLGPESSTLIKAVVLLANAPMALVVIPCGLWVVFKLAMDRPPR